MGSLTTTTRLIGLLGTLAALGVLGCTRGEPAAGDVAHLIASPPGVLPPTYTLADETRPVLALPPERRLDLPVSPTSEAAYTFTLPEDLTGDVIATGFLQRDKHFHPLQPQLLTRSRDPDGSPRATLTLPAAALGDGPPSTLTLMLTTPPSASTVETIVDAVSVPPEARLELAFGLSQAAAISGAAPVTLEVAAAPEDGPEQTLWSATIPSASADGTRWNEITIPLAPIAGTHARFVFRARTIGEGRPVVLPLWADPTIVAPQARPAAQRNVILISIDTLRADRLAPYGAYRRTMPQVEAFARNAVTFTDTWSVWPETSGSHMSLFSSRFPSEHGVLSFINAPSPTLELLAERLRRAGYLTRAFTEDGGVWAHAGFARGFSAYAERRSADFVYRGEAAEVFKDATRWVDAHADRTFFLFLHTYQVHAPYSPPPDYRDLFSDVPGREAPRYRDSALAYDQEARYTDDHIGPFLAHLARLGLSDRTIVVVTADHGEEFGEHGGIGHGRNLFPEVLRVPLVIAAPGLLKPTEVTTPTSLLDVAPTVLDLVGLEPIPGHRGISLLGRARAAAAGSPIDPAEAARPIFGEVDRLDRVEIRQVSVRRNHATAIVDLTTNTIRCYTSDGPMEEKPSGPCPELSGLIDQHRKSSVLIGAPVAPSRPADPALIEKMRALGYIE